MASSNISMLKKTGNNSTSDECYTPEKGIMPLLKYLPKDKLYYECTSDKSNAITDLMVKEGYRILQSSGRDFLTTEVPNGVDIILTNPPYSKKDEFIKRCYNSGLPFALLLPVSSLQGQARGRLFDKYGIEILVLNKRVDFTGGGSPHFGVGWFCHKILPKDLMFI